MACYAIGDVQGCYDDLMGLLKLIDFDASVDQLWFAGDLVNRGPESLEVLRFVKSLEIKPIVTLGNHDLTLLAVAYGAIPKKKKDTIDDVLQAADCMELCDWLRHQSLMHYDADSNYVISHAGIAPSWPIDEALSLAKEVETILQSDQHIEFYSNMYGDEPHCWSDDLTGWERYRLITNYFTRMRFTDMDGCLNLAIKSGLDTQPEGHLPWFKVPTRKTKDRKLLFGHWAALEGQTDEKNVFALDTGCVWGGALTAMRLEDGKMFRYQE